MKKIFTLDLNNINPNHKRWSYFLKELNFEFSKNKFFFKKTKAIFICDSQSKFEQICAMLQSIIRNDDLLIFGILETYSFDIAAFLGERLCAFYSLIQNNKIGILHKYLKLFKLIIGTTAGGVIIITINLVLYLKNLQTRVVIIVPSELRMKYLKSKLMKKNYFYYVLQNKLLLSDINSINFYSINKNDNNLYIILSGRINNHKLLIDLSIRLLQMEVKILVVGASDEENASIFKNYCNIKLIKNMPHIELLNTVNNALAGLVIYSNSTINQRFSASGKLFEFMALGIPIIVSDNIGAIKDLTMNKIKYTLIEDLIKCDTSIEILINEIMDRKRSINVDYSYEKDAQTVAKEICLKYL